VNSPRAKRLSDVVITATGEATMCEFMRNDAAGCAS
jgi:hypothetical protein